MSIYAIQQYHKELEKIIHYGGSKEQVIDLLMRVCTVSVETMKVVGEMEEVPVG